MHKAHLSAGGAKSAVGRATAVRCKTLPGDAYSYYTAYGEKTYSLENMVLPNRERSKKKRHMRHPTPTRWLITPHPADLSRVLHQRLVREYAPFAAACLNSHNAEEA